MKKLSDVTSRERSGQGSGPSLLIHFHRNLWCRYACTGKPQWEGSPFLLQNSVWLYELNLMYCVELQHVLVDIHTDCYFLKKEPPRELCGDTVLCTFLLSPSHAPLILSFFIWPSLIIFFEECISFDFHTVINLQQIISVLTFIGFN